MKITIYELLGLIKDRKAPEKIRYDGTIYEYSENDDFYYWAGLSLYREFATNGNCLDNEVEIIEEDKKMDFEKIEELTCNEYDFKTRTINSLIKNQRKLIDEINNLKKEK